MLMDKARGHEVARVDLMEQILEEDGSEVEMGAGASERKEELQSMPPIWAGSMEGQRKDSQRGVKHFFLDFA